MITTENVNPSVYFYNGTNSCVMTNGLTITGTNNQCSTNGNAQNRRLLNQINPAQGQYYAGIGQIDDGATANYEALNLSVQRRLNRGVSASGNYTWSHCISDVYSDTRPRQAYLRRITGANSAAIASASM
jgi:hypothetical protein